MKSEAKPSGGVVAKVPRVRKEDGGAYICMVLPWGNSRNSLFPFNVDVAVDGERSGKECTRTLGSETQQHYLFKHPVATILQSIYFKKAFSKVYGRSVMKITLS